MAAAKRKGISNKLRFEIFKRDSFKCQYCGASAPDVILNVDHINPVAKGGVNDILNLVTSCFTCNSGKSDRKISDNSAVTLQKKQLDELSERRSQIEMLIKWKTIVEDKSFEVREMAVTERIKAYKNTAAIEGGITGAGGIFLGLADFFFDLSAFAVLSIISLSRLILTDVSYEDTL